MLLIVLCAVAARYRELPQAVAPIPGYRCMLLSPIEPWAIDSGARAPVQVEPDPGAKVEGYVVNIVAVRNLSDPVNGFLEIIDRTGARVWIKGDLVKPYPDFGDPTGRCVPSSMSDGSIGFDYPHG